MSVLNELATAVLKGDYAGIGALTQKAIDAGIAPLEIINGGLIEGMNIVAPKFKAGDIMTSGTNISPALNKGGTILVRT